MKYLYNNSEYFIDDNRNIFELIKTINLPLIAWYNILKLRVGIINIGDLLDILKFYVEYNDKSSNVNSFIYKEKEYWFDKNTRASLLALVSCSENTITLVLGDELIEIEVSKAKKFLSDLEIYASKCFVNTQKHLNAIKELKTVEDIINYDYTKGYPDKLKFDEYLDLA